jgi:hypothetical protein
MAVLISLAALADLMLMRVLRMTGVTGRFLEYLMFAALLLIPYPIARSRRLPRVQHMVVLLITVLLSNCTLSVLIVLAGRANAPLIDGVLAGIDRSFGFSIGAVVKWIGQSPMLFSGSWLLYRTLAPIVILPIFVLPMRGLERVGQRYVLSVSVAAILTAGIFALFPAIGPWTVYSFKPTIEQATYHRYFVDALRSQVTADVS